MTVLTKLTKTAKKQLIREALATGIFNRDNMRKVLNCSDRSMRRYLNEIAVEDAEQNPETLHVLRSICTLKLISKATRNKLSDRNMLAVVLAGETRKVEVKTESTEKVLHATIDLTKLAQNERKAILEAEEAITRAEKSIREG